MLYTGLAGLKLFNAAFKKDVEKHFKKKRIRRKMKKTNRRESGV